MKKLQMKLIVFGVFLVGGFYFLSCGETAEKMPEVIVYKSPTCGCCGKWVEHMQKNGFTVTVHDVQDVTPYKNRNGIAEDLASCHTAIVGNYVVEGHVPAAEVRKMIVEKPAIRGISVPGMPIGSPGMEQGEHKDNYDVIAFDMNGKRSVFASY